MTADERHERHHQHLANLQTRIERIEASAYANAKRMKAHAPRKFARRSSYSQRVSLNAAWRSHLQGLHGVKDLGPFVGLAELQAMHERLHTEEN